MKQSGLDCFDFHSKPIMFSITSRPGGLLQGFSVCY